MSSDAFVLYQLDVRIQVLEDRPAVRACDRRSHGPREAGQGNGKRRGEILREATESLHGPWRCSEGDTGPADYIPSQPFSFA